MYLTNDTKSWGKGGGCVGVRLKIKVYRMNRSRLHPKSTLIKRIHVHSFLLSTYLVESRPIMGQNS